MKISIEDYERITPALEVSIKGKKVVFYVPSAVTKWRVETLFTKEPWTIEWLMELNERDVLLDIGANVGMYSILPAAIRGCQVTAIEPESSNYAILNRNIRYNNLSHLVRAFCVGVSDSDGFSVLNMQDLSLGGSNHSVGDALNFRLERMAPRFVQGCACFSVDSLVSSGRIPFPTRIKVDIDGYEHKVIAGATKTLSNPLLTSLLIETNTNLLEHQEMIRALAEFDFRFSVEQAEMAMRKSGSFQGVAEYVFRR